MQAKRRDTGLHPAVWTAILLATVVAMVFVSIGMYNGSFARYAKVTLISDRAGLVMTRDAKVKLRGVQVGRVSSIALKDPTRLELEIYEDQLKYIPANVAGRIDATTVFGAKHVELISPSDPSPKRLESGAVVRSADVSTEVNTVFENLVGLLNKIDVPKLNAVLSAFGEALRGKGEALGDAITDADHVLKVVNPRSETFRADLRALRDFADVYGKAAPDFVTVMDALSTTSETITNNAEPLDALLLNTAGFSRSGIDLLGPNKENLVHAVNVLEPTTRLLMKYNPQHTCMLVGGKTLLDWGWADVTGGRNGKSVILDVALLLGDDPYKYPEHLPIVDIKGGPGGEPSCGSLPDVSKNFPHRYLVTNSGWGRGPDVRHNPGIGFPGWANYFPVTRAVPEPPRIYHPGGPAPGLAPPYPGGPPYGAQQYAEDGTPLYPGLPPAPPPGRPRAEGPPPAGSEPFVPAVSGAQPIPNPLPAPPSPPQGPPPGPEPTP